MDADASSLNAGDSVENREEKGVENSCSSHGHQKTSCPRVVRDGKVAVIIQSGYGGGWYYKHRTEAFLFDPVIVEMIEKHVPRSRIYEYCRKNGLDVDEWGCDDLSITWVPVSAKFRINEYDGQESVVFKLEDTWFQA